MTLQLSVSLSSVVDQEFRNVHQRNLVFCLFLISKQVAQPLNTLCVHHLG